MNQFKLSCLVLLMVAVGCTAVAMAAPAEPSYPIDSTVLTTVERTVQPVEVPVNAPKLLPTDIPKFAKNGYGFCLYRRICYKGGKIAAFLYDYRYPYLR